MPLLHIPSYELLGRKLTLHVLRSGIEFLAKATALSAIFSWLARQACALRCPLSNDVCRRPAPFNPARRVTQLF